MPPTQTLPPEVARICALLQQAAAALDMACAPRLQPAATLGELGLEFHTLVALLMVVEPAVGWLPSDLLDGLPHGATVRSLAERVAAAVAPVNDPSFGRSVG